jgi:hypothetical protein
MANFTVLGTVEEGSGKLEGNYVLAIQNGKFPAKNNNQKIVVLNTKFYGKEKLEKWMDKGLSEFTFEKTGETVEHGESYKVKPKRLGLSVENEEYLEGKYGSPRPITSSFTIENEEEIEEEIVEKK